MAWLVDYGKTAVGTCECRHQAPGRHAVGAACCSLGFAVLIESLPGGCASLAPSHAFGPSDQRLAASVADRPNSPTDLPYSSCKRRYSIGQCYSREKCHRAAGLATTFVTASYLDDLLFGISPRDPFVYGLVVVGVAIVGLLANVVPARRAAALDPMRALRTE